MTYSIAALGPQNTFSEQAALVFLARWGAPAKLLLFPTMKRVFAAAEGSCDAAVLPIENMIDGYVQPVLDLLLAGTLSIVEELLLPIRLSFVACCARPAEVKRVYVHPVAAGQCGEFLASLPDIESVATLSNGDSLERIAAGEFGDGAIVPSFALAKGAKGTFPLVVEGVSDHPENRTRFIALCRQSSAGHPVDCQDCKTSLVILETVDRPGTLAEILSAFAKRAINLVSIMSRPTKELLGRYHFFIDIEGHALAPDVQAALGEVARHGQVKLLGSYPRARALSPSLAARAPA